MDKIYIVVCAKGEYDGHVTFNVAWSDDIVSAEFYARDLEDELNAFDRDHKAWLELHPPPPQDVIWTPKANAWHEAAHAEIRRLLAKSSSKFQECVTEYDPRYDGVWRGRPDFWVTKLDKVP